MATLQGGHSYTKVGLRRPIFAQLPQISRMLALAFQDEPMFGEFIHPYRHQYPHDTALWWLKRFRKDYYKPNEVFLMTVDESGGTKNGVVVTGIAQWSRSGDPEELQKLGWAPKAWWDIRNLLCLVVSAYSSICSWIWPNRASPPWREGILEETEHFSKHHWTGNRSSHWYLHLLGVHPDYQNKGIGRALVAWGMNQARREGVACSVISAYGKDDFYQRCGFNVCVGRAGDGEGNPVAVVPGGNIWFRDFQLEKETSEKDSGLQKLSYKDELSTGES